MCRSSGRRLMFLSSRVHGEGEVQTRAAAVSQSHAPPHPWPTAFFLTYAQTTVHDAAVGAGAYLSCTPRPLRTKAECIYSPACHPAASGRGITLATMNKQGLIEKPSLACLVTHWHTSRVHHTITAEVFCSVFLVSAFATSVLGFYQTRRLD